MAITNFIPTIWSEHLLESLNNEYIAVAHCNREYEGEIKKKGSCVNICGVGKIFVNDLYPEADLNSPQEINDTCIEMSIDQAKYFNFMISDIDRAQFSPNLLTHTTKIAANALAKAADLYVFNLCKEVNNEVYCNDLTSQNFVNALIAARQKLYEANVHEGANVVLEVPPVIASEILKAKITLPFSDTSSLETGYLGSFAGCKIYVTNNLVSTREGTTISHTCIMRTTRAVAFAEQISEIIAFRPEQRFADAVKGLHVYGAKVIYPEEIVKIRFDVSAE